MQCYATPHTSGFVRSFPVRFWWFNRAAGPPQSQLVLLYPLPFLLPSQLICTCPGITPRVTWSTATFCLLGWVSFIYGIGVGWMAKSLPRLTINMRYVHSRVYSYSLPTAAKDSSIVVVNKIFLLTLAFNILHLFLFAILYLSEPSFCPT